MECRAFDSQPINPILHVVDEHLIDVHVVVGVVPGMNVVVVILDPHPNLICTFPEVATVSLLADPVNRAPDVVVDPPVVLRNRGGRTDGAGERSSST